MPSLLRHEPFLQFDLDEQVVPLCGSPYTQLPLEQIAVEQVFCGRLHAPPLLVLEETQVPSCVPLG